MIQAIVFDMDDTLYEEKEYVKSGFKQLDTWVINNFQKTGFYEIATRLFNVEDRKFIFNKSLEYLNLPYNPEVINEMLTIYRTHEPDIEMPDDARWVINVLKCQVKLGLITDGFLISQQKKIKALKLKDSFHAIILSDKYGREHWKPSVIPYEAVSNELQCRHHECVYIGDNVNKDFITPNKLGWTTVQLERKNGIYANAFVSSEYHAQYQITNLKQLANIRGFKRFFTTNKVVVE